jgi:hypothetical protein
MRVRLLKIEFQVLIRNRRGERQSPHTWGINRLPPSRWVYWYLMCAFWLGAERAIRHSSIPSQNCEIELSIRRTGQSMHTPHTLYIMVGHQIPYHNISGVLVGNTYTSIYNWRELFLILWGGLIVRVAIDANAFNPHHITINSLPLH